MTATTPEAKRLLDQLQGEINRVLEQTGRLFAAAKIHGSVPPVAQASRLKQALPDCIDKFHSALDELEDELQTAKIVLRRDLALLRAKHGPIRPSGNAIETEAAAEARPDVSMSDDSKAVEASITDADMTDDPPNVSPSEPLRAPSPQAEPEATSIMAMDDAPGEKPEDNNPTDPSKDYSPLVVDTSNQPAKSTDDNQADTGTGSNNADLDSLFGGSVDASATTEAGNDAVNMDTTHDNDAGDFDFGAFTDKLNTGGQGNGADEDHIAALLPGLQVYANTGTADGAGGSGDPEFDAIFGDNSNDAQENNGQGQADDIFGDLLADFPSGAYSNQGQDHDFDFGFS